MSDPTINPTMMDISITEVVNNSKDTDNLSHNKNKVKTISDEESNRNNKKISEKQVNNL